MRHSMMNGAALAPTPERDMLQAGIDIIPDRKNNTAARRAKKGECPTCGLQTHQVSFLGKKKPLTVEGQVFKGRCLNCYPLEGYIRRPQPHPQMGQQHQHPDAPLVIPRTLEVEVDDEDFSVVSGITMDMRLIQGARNWDPSQGVDYDSDEEPPAGLPSRRPDASVGGDDPYADSRPDPARPPRTKPSYVQSMRQLGAHNPAQNNRDFGGMPPRKPPPIPPTGQPPGRFQQNQMHLLGKSEGSLGSGSGPRRPMNPRQGSSRDGNMPGMDQKPPFHPQGFNEPGRQKDPYDYPNEQFDKNNQNYMSGPSAGYSSGAGPALDADGYPIASSNFGWDKNADMLPPGGIDSLFKPNRIASTSGASQSQVRSGVAPARNEITFNPVQKQPPPPSHVLDIQAHAEEMEHSPSNEQKNDNPDQPHRHTSYESGPMYQSDDFPTYIEDNDIPLPETGLKSQNSGPVFYVSETIEPSRLEMNNAVPTMLQTSKTTGPDVFSRYHGGRGPPSARPSMSRISSNTTSDSSFAPPLISRDLRGRPDDDVIQDPMGAMMCAMPIGRKAVDAPKTSSPQFQQDMGRGRNAYGEGATPTTQRDDPYHFHQRGEETSPYGEVNEPPKAEQRSDMRGQFNQRHQGLDSMSHEAGNGGPSLSADTRTDGRRMPNYGIDNPGHGQSMNYRPDPQHKPNYNTSRLSDAGPEIDYEIDERNTMAFESSMVAERNRTTRNRPNYGDAASSADHSMVSIGNDDFGMISLSDSLPTGEHGREFQRSTSPDMMRPGQIGQTERNGGPHQHAHASASAPPGSDQVQQMFRKLSTIESQSPTPSSERPKVKPPSKSKNKKDGTIHDIPAILHCLNLDGVNSNLREKALLSLSEILWKSGEKARSFIVEHKGVDTLVKSMWADISDAKVQAAALAFLFSLSASPDGKASGDMLSNEESICDSLLFSMQMHAADPGIQLHGCAILACLASASSNNVKVSDGSLSGALMMVVNAMSYHSGSREIQKAGLQALNYQCLLSTNAESNKRTLMESSTENGGSGIDVVLMAMDTLKDDVVAMEWACRLFWCLASSQDLVKSLPLNSVIGMLTELCQQYIPDQEAADLIEASFGIIGNLAFLESNRLELERAGAVLCLIDGMRYHTNEFGVILEACSALANLSVSLPVREAIAQSGGIESIARALQSFGDNEDLVAEALRGLVCLSIDSPENKQSIAVPEVLETVVNASKTHHEAARMLEMSLLLFASLAVGNSISEDIVSSSGVDTIMKGLAATADEKVRDAACLSYRNLSCQLDDSDRLLKPGVVHAIENAMQKYENSISIQTNACCTFWNLAFKTEREPGTIVSSQGIKCIVKAMQSHLESGELLELACGAMWSLVDDSIERKKDVVGNGAIDAVACAVVMHPGRGSTLEKALGVLSNVSMERPLAEAIANAQGVSIIVEAMRNNGSLVSMLEVGCNALRNLIFQYPEYASEASSVISVVISAMKQNPEAVTFQQEACNLLWVLAAEAENCQSKILSLDGVAVVMKCMEIPEVQESALGAFRQLASGSNMSMP